jgi:hypothetical protein
MRWYTGLGRQVWPREINNFLFRERRTNDGPTVRELWGEPQEHEGFAMAVPSDGPTENHTENLEAPRMPSCSKDEPNNCVKREDVKM